MPAGEGIKTPQRRELSPAMHFWAGGTGGMVGALITGPLEMVKTRLQAERNRTELRESGKQKAFGSRLYYALKHVHSTSGVAGLWRGIGPHLAGTVPARAIYFGVYNESKKRYVASSGKDSALMHWFAAVTAGVCCVTVTSPLWVIKTRMQLQTPTDRMYRNSLDCAIQMIRREGPVSLFRGLSASLVGISESSMQFVLYEQGKKMAVANRSDKELRTWEYLTAACMAKTIAVLATYPHEVVRTRMREVPVEGRPRRYVAFTQSLMLVGRSEGIAGLYGGMAAHLMRVVPNACLMFLTYELFVRYYAFN